MKVRDDRRAVDSGQSRGRRAAGEKGKWPAEESGVTTRVPRTRAGATVKLGDEGSQSFCSAERREASAQECKMRGSILPIMG